MNVEIVRLDDFGRGIGYVDGKIIFIPKTLPGDLVNVNVTLDKKKFLEGEVIEYIKESNKKIKSECKYFDKCGGCQYLNMSYNDALDEKINIFENNFKRAGFNQNVISHSNDNIFNYRNKISLKIVDSKIGFYEANSNTLVEIDYCHLASTILNKYVDEIKKLKIVKGSVVLRSNYKNEVLVIIETKNKIDIELLNKEDVVGIILNDEVIYGDNYFVDELSNLKFEIMYNSFFQVNPYITEKIISLLKENINNTDIVLDLYSGVGTLSLNAALKAKKVYGIEIIKNAVINAKNNALINNIENTEFIVGDLSKTIKIKDKINTFIVDPPRSGIDKVVMNKINELKPSKIIYISCNPNTLIRDLKLLEDYSFDYVAVFDMFSHTAHLESFVVLKRSI